MDNLWIKGPELKFLMLDGSLILTTGGPIDLLSTVYSMLKNVSYSCQIKLATNKTKEAQMCQSLALFTTWLWLAQF